MEVIVYAIQRKHFFVMFSRFMWWFRTNYHVVTLINVYNNRLKINIKIKKIKIFLYLILIIVLLINFYILWSERTINPLHTGKCYANIHTWLVKNFNQDFLEIPKHLLIQEKFKDINVCRFLSIQQRFIELFIRKRVAHINTFTKNINSIYSIISFRFQIYMFRRVLNNVYNAKLKIIRG